MPPPSLILFCPTSHPLIPPLALDSLHDTPLKTALTPDLETINAVIVPDLEGYSSDVRLRSHLQVCIEQQTAWKLAGVGQGRQGIEPVTMSCLLLRRRVTPALY